MNNKYKLSAKKARAIYTVPRFSDGSKSNEIERGNKRL